MSVILTGKMATVNDEMLIAEYEKQANAQHLQLVNTARMDRRAARSKITKATNMLEQFVADPEADVVSIQEGIDNLNRVVKECENKDHSVQSLLEYQKVSDADMRLSMRWYNAASTALIQAKRKLLQLQPPLVAPPHLATAATTSAATEFKIPKFDLPKFKGESPIEYQDFKSQFDSMVDKSTKIDEVGKLLALKSCCIDQAGTIAEGFPITAANYKELYKTLDER